MPVQYSGIIDEHNAVRNSVGLFDVSHMGEIEIRGPEPPNSSISSPPTTPPNSNTARRTTPVCSTNTAALSTTSWSTRSPTTISSSASTPRTRTRISSTSARTTPSTPRSISPATLLAARHPGPERPRHAAETHAGGSRRDQVLLVHRWRSLRHARPHRAHRLYRRGRIRNLHPARRSRTYLNEIMKAGAEFGIKPCGLGARNTLRLESKMAQRVAGAQAAGFDAEFGAGLHDFVPDTFCLRRAGCRFWIRPRRYSRCARCGRGRAADFAIGEPVILDRGDTHRREFLQRGAAVARGEWQAAE